MIEPIVKNDRFMIRFQKSTAVSSRSGSSSSRAMICWAPEPFDNSLPLGPAEREHGRLAGRKEGRAEQQDGHRQETGEEHGVKIGNPKSEIRNKSEIQNSNECRK